ncbi:MAG: cupredoxin domain-containing protein [Chloroflexota bacterium]
MRRLLLPLAVLLIALAAAACAGSTGPGWTYAPPTEPPAATPVPSGDASQAPGSEAPASETPSDGAGGTVIQLSALNVDWEQKALSAPADTAFTIHFNNKDASVPHDVVIKDAGGMEMFRGQLTTGPQEIDYQVPALAAGTYQFVCSVHPNMIGTLTVGG